ncbi:hypothetical protein NIES4075_55180 [Tolypothrix sp. NIES-4075]|uniref:DUF2973 domain-containing protein n=1 Tax=Tolypothrix sp. NIES-4075 TaxID=2005459 RepID=UPI000B5C6B1F|nr:DUF2973 domain-containing protein [Tolypothrix sp. NIES-4075]GAX44499.1 hypothetical protein NIES4075_55180 [Tolypothrix sp. NIES-4075]
MLHLLYILAFTILAFIAVANLIRNLMMFSFDTDRTYSRSSIQQGNSAYMSSSRKQFIPHPELLDSSGNLIKEPLLVMRSVNVEDARQQLDALYESSPGQKSEKEEG